LSLIVELDAAQMSAGPLNRDGMAAPTPLQ